MIEEILSRIDDELQSNSSLSQEKKEEIRGLLNELRDEVLLLQTTHHDDAAHIAAYTGTSVREALRDETSSELLKHSVEGLSLSAGKFEVTHPKLTALINSIGNTLVNIGI